MTSHQMFWLREALIQLGKQNYGQAEEFVKMAFDEALSTDGPPSTSAWLSTPGTVEKPLQSGSVSQEETGTPSAQTEAISEDSKSTLSIEDAFEASLRSCLILLEMWRLRTTSGESRDGNPGPVSRSAPVAPPSTPGTAIWPCPSCNANLVAVQPSWPQKNWKGEPCFSWGCFKCGTGVLIPVRISVKRMDSGSSGNEASEPTPGPTAPPSSESSNRSEIPA